MPNNFYDCGDIDHQYGCKCKETPKEAPKQEWCKHASINPITKTPVVSIWPLPTDTQFCPICSAPRPKPLSKQERLAIYLYQEFQDMHKEQLFEAQRNVQHHYMELAGKVLKWMEAQ